MTIRRGLRALAATIVAAFAAAPAWAQCAMCRATIENSPEALARGAELNQAILLLFVAPYMVASTLTLALFRQRIAAGLRARLAAFRAR
jgi:hypothetical protein